MKRILLVGGLLAGSVSLTLFACVSDSNTTVIDAGPLADDGGGTMTTNGTDGASSVDGGGGGPGTDGGSSGSCTSACTNPTTLKACLPDGAASSVACTYDCVVDGGPHCNAFVPTPPVSAADIDFTGLADVVVSADGFLQTDTGSFDNVRAGSPDAGATDTQQGVRYHVVNGMGIFSMKSLTIQTGVTLKLRGSLPAAIVADTITVKGIIDARGYGATGVLCSPGAAGPGGYQGGWAYKEAGAGPGGGAYGLSSGAGGGGYGGVGGQGGSGGAEGGSAYAFTTPIVGGSGGGSGSTIPGGVNLSYGGGGGGAVQLVGVTSISIGNTGTAAGINAGGCGAGGSMGMGNVGAGGGAGGTIFVESPTLNFHDTCVLASNGGGASSGGGAPAGDNGTLDGNPAAGGAKMGNGTGGSGGAGGSIGGGMGTSAAGGTGGGGATGRIHLLNYAGSFTPGGSVTLSPGQTTTATTVGKVGLK